MFPLPDVFLRVSLAALLGCPGGIPGDLKLQVRGGVGISGCDLPRDLVTFWNVLLYFWGLSGLYKRYSF